MSVSRDDYYSVAADAQRLSTRLSEAEARIAELERERDELRQQLEDYEEDAVSRQELLDKQEG